MADWEDIVLGGAVGIVGGYFVTRKKGEPKVPPIIAEALERHKASVEQKISNQKQEPSSEVVGAAGLSSS